MKRAVSWLREKAWSPYIAGGLVGVLSWFAILTVKPLGASTTFVRTAGMIEKIFASDHVEQLPYFVTYMPKIDWQWMLVLGILIGAYLSSRLSGQYETRFIPPMWAERFGTRKARRWIVAFIGGILIIFGARMAGG
jgi:hypothetical protein